MSSAPIPSSANMSTGTQVGLTFTSRGIGGVYRVDALGRLDAGVVPLAVTRPLGTLRLAGLAMGGETSHTGAPPFRQRSRAMWRVSADRMTCAHDCARRRGHRHQLHPPRRG